MSRASRASHDLSFESSAPLGHGSPDWPAGSVDTGHSYIGIARPKAAAGSARWRDRNNGDGYGSATAFTAQRRTWLGQPHALREDLLQQEPEKIRPTEGPDLAGAAVVGRAKGYLADVVTMQDVCFESALR
jgi:hypothetical protein